MSGGGSARPRLQRTEEETAKEGVRGRSKNHRGGGASSCLEGNTNFGKRLRGVSYNSGDYQQQHFIAVQLCVI